MDLKSQPLIHINQLCFRYGTTTVLSSIGASFKRGGFYLIIGPNGGGKTTLLKLLMGLLEPQSGTITIAGKAPFEMRSSIGYVPQTFFFDPKFPLTVEEFVLMGSLSRLTWLGTYPKEVKKRCKTLLSDVGMLDFRDALIGKISGGQRQRASLARALMSDPEILLLDEPTTGLDRTASDLIDEKLRDLKGKKTILMVTHTMPHFLDIVDEVICIRGIAEIVSKETVCSHHALGVYHATFIKGKDK